MAMSEKFLLPSFELQDVKRCRGCYAYHAELNKCKSANRGIGLVDINGSFQAGIRQDWCPLTEEIKEGRITSGEVKLALNRIESSFIIEALHISVEQDENVMKLFAWLKKEFGLEKELD